MKKRQLVRITKKAKPENRTAFRLRFMSCEHCLLCCGIGKEGTLFPPFLLFLFLQFLLGLHFLQNLFQRLDRFRFLTLEPLEIDVLYKLWKRHFPRFRSGLESSSSQVLKSIFSKDIWLPLSGLCLPLSSVQRYHSISTNTNH